MKRKREYRMFDTYAYFFVSGFEDEPSAITQLLEIEPTKTWKKGDDWLPVKKRPKNNRQLHSRQARSEPFLNQTSVTSFPSFEASVPDSRKLTSLE